MGRLQKCCGRPRCGGRGPRARGRGGRAGRAAGARSPAPVPAALTQAELEDVGVVGPEHDEDDHEHRHPGKHPAAAAQPPGQSHLPAPPHPRLEDRPSGPAGAGLGLAAGGGAALHCLPWRRPPRGAARRERHESRRGGAGGGGGRRSGPGRGCAGPSGRQPAPRPRAHPQRQRRGPPMRGDCSASSLGSQDLCLGPFLFVPAALPPTSTQPRSERHGNRSISRSKSHPAPPSRSCLREALTT